MGHSRTPTQNTAGDGFPADPIDGYRVPTPVLPLPPASSICADGRPSAEISAARHPVGRHADCRNRPEAPQLTVRARGSHAGDGARGPGAAAGESA